MKYIIIALFALLLSCSPTKNYYLYSRLDTNQPTVIKNESGQFAVNSDSLNILYSFSGKNISVNAIIENKLDKSVFIDWNKSWLNANNSNYNIYYNSLKNLPIVEIEANKKKEITLLLSAYFDFRKTNDFALKKQIYDTNTMAVNFTQTDSPLILTCTLSFLLDDAKGTRLNRINHFYLASLHRVNKRTFKMFVSTIFDRGDNFYTHIEVDKNSNSKFGDKLFEFIIGTTVHSIGKGSIQNYSEPEDYLDK